MKELEKPTTVEHPEGGTIEVRKGTIWDVAPPSIKALVRKVQNEAQLGALSDAWELQKLENYRLKKMASATNIVIPGNGAGIKRKKVRGKPGINTGRSLKKRSAFF